MTHVYMMCGLLSSAECTNMHAWLNNVCISVTFQVEIMGLPFVMSIIDGHGSVSEAVSSKSLNTPQPAASDVPQCVEAAALEACRVPAATSAGVFVLSLLQTQADCRPIRSPTHCCSNRAVVYLHSLLPGLTTGPSCCLRSRLCCCVVVVYPKSLFSHRQAWAGLVVGATA